MKVPVEIYDSPDTSSNNPVASLDKAFDISYRQRINEVWSASFAYLADNDKNDLFELLDYAEIYDGDKRIGLFRIDEKIPQRSEDESYIQYECSHVLDTLNDDYIVDKVTKSGSQTAVQYVMDQQSNWQLGNFDFSKSFDYEFKHQTLLRALLDVPQPWWEDYELTFDTTSYPWTLNVKNPSTTPQGTVRYGKNISTIDKEVNAKDLITKLYAFGEGSGDDQVSAGPYTSNTGTYGTIVGIWEEQYFENSSDLGTAAQKYLDRADTPKVTYKVNAADLYQLINSNELKIGDYITVYDDELGFDDKVRIVEKSKRDVTGSPGEVRLELSNKTDLFPDYGALAFRDKATEDHLASSSVGGGAGGALGNGSVGTNELANNATTWDKIQFTDASGDYMEQTRLKIDALVTFENNFTEIDKLEDGTTYAKMRKSWRSASDVTKIAGGEIYTDSITLDAVNFSPVESEDVIASINASSESLTIQYGKIDQDVATENNVVSKINLGKESATISYSYIDQDVATENNVVSKINLNKEGVQITGDQIELNGTTTVNGTFTVDKIPDGSTYAKMRKDWRSSSDVTKIAGGQIYTDSITLSQVNFSPVEESEVIADINASSESLTINYGQMDQAVATENNVVSKINLNKEGIRIVGNIIELDGDTTVDGNFEVKQGNITVDQNIVMDATGTPQAITGCNAVGYDSSVAIAFAGGVITTNVELETEGGIDVKDNNITNVDLINGTSWDIHVASSAAHHSKYTNSEAITAINNDSDHGSTASHNYFGGSHNDLSGISSSQHHSKYTDSEAITAINNDSDHGSTADHSGISFSHSDLSGVGSSDHHSKYTDSEAVNAVENDPGLELSNNLNMQYNNITNVGTVDGKDISGWSEGYQGLVYNIDLDADGHVTNIDYDYDNYVRG